MQLPRVDIQGTSVRPVVPATLAIGHAHSATEAAMKYMSDPFPARRDQHAFQIASRTFFTRRPTSSPAAAVEAGRGRVVGHGLSLRRMPPNLSCFRVLIAQPRSERTVRPRSRSCLTEGNPPPLLINYWRRQRRRRRRQQLSNNIELAVASMATAAARARSGSCPLWLEL